eukprot:TRINITY_DN1577_c0_g5_i2.p1 TRINITY_DN1577_c0_g5~~TRINITY_DN1577_c0_g5_i2.p1  ORF type:complete len:396 (-),score=152.42 TRINITY_DN1577_c0_g5_i2:56-1243(-)
MNFNFLFLFSFVLVVAFTNANEINVNFAGLLSGSGAGSGSGSGSSAADVAALQKTVADLTASNNAMKKKLMLMGFQESTAYAPIPPNSYPATQRSDGMSVIELGSGSGVWFVSDSAYNSAVIDIGSSLVVVDAPPTYSEARLRSALSFIGGNKTVSHFIYSHTHNDHVGLAGLFASTATYISHPITSDLVKRNGKLPVPTITTPNNTKMTLGNKNFEFYYFDNAHADGNLLIWLPAQKVVVYIDIVYPQWVPFYALGITQDSYRFVRVHDTLLTFNFDYFISGHLGRIATRSDVTQAQQYLADLTTVIGQTYALFPFEKYYAAYQGPPVNWWALLHNWEGDMATECAGKMMDKYKGKLAGVDVYAWTHCWHLREAIDLFTPMDGGKRKRSLFAQL